jgi:hypothetical protein
MPQDKLSTVLRIHDNETRLLERADQKAISLLSALGVFMVFFIVYYRVIPVNPATVGLIAFYFLCALSAILSLIMTVRPRISSGEPEASGDEGSSQPCEPAFFAGICRFPDLSAYRKSLDEMTRDETGVINIYTRQIFSLAQLNATKYKYLRRATLLVIVALATELAIIAYLFINYLGEGALPPIF